MKNYGFNPQRQENELDHERDYSFGSVQTNGVAVLPAHQQLQYLPQGEIQRGVEDMMDCATRGFINVLEAKLTYLHKNDLLPNRQSLFLLNSGYIVGDEVKLSDAFNAIKSGTTRAGNSLKAPIQSIHSDGVIPKAMLPLENYMTFDMYHDPVRITKKMEVLGQQFLNYFSVQYERVPLASFLTAVQQDYLVVGGYAWPEPEGGVYPATEMPFNHVWVNYGIPAWQAFDNYIDSTDGDYTKTLHPDYTYYRYGYRVILNFTTPPVWTKDLVKRFLDLWR